MLLTLSLQQEVLPSREKFTNRKRRKQIGSDKSTLTDKDNLRKRVSIALLIYHLKFCTSKN